MRRWGIIKFAINGGVIIAANKGDDVEIFHQEKVEIFKAGLVSTPYQQIDGTGAKVNGEKHHVQIICNPYYSIYFTLPHKDRLSGINRWCGFAPKIDTVNSCMQYNIVMYLSPHRITIRLICHPQRKFHVKNTIDSL